MITSIQDIVKAFSSLLGALLPISVAVALLVFLWGLATFIFRLGQGDEASVAEGKSRMLWGVIILFVMVSIWGIVKFIAQDIIGGTTPTSIPINGLQCPPCTDSPQDYPGCPAVDVC